MPTYCYRTARGKRWEWTAPMGAAPKVLLAGGEMALRDIAAEHGNTRSGDAWTNHASLALMVHPGDVPRYVEDARKKGIRVEFNDRGMPLFHSRSEQRKYLKAYDYVNYDDY